MKPVWGTSSPCCGPEVGSLEPGQLDEAGGPNGYTTVWQAVIQPNINLSDLKRDGTSSLS
ncbi:hypothetical protein F5880DRAFT_1609294 [Lentinula raphanica]|nr:hypothetical protein F5880DRAFT_1609294 [Lentinula raphanica]